MTNSQSSYRAIIKSTSLFGGVQVFNILISIIKSKFVAVLLGPTGMGIVGLLTSTIGVVTGLTNFGLGTSAVKNVAAANGTGNSRQISVIITVLRRWVWVTGLLGMLVTIFTAPLLSQFTFGNREYTFPFIWISISLLFKQLSSGQMIVLQGLQKLQYLAKANLAGSTLGLLVSVPLYYWLGIHGIVPVIIISAAITLISSWYFSRKIDIEKVIVSRQRTIAEGKDMLKMGFLISLAGLLTSVMFYLIRIYISNTGGVNDVGLFSAGDAILSSYFGLVFSALATDYYPRLSKVAKENQAASLLINQQAEITVLILTPILTVFLIFIHWVIILLYSAQFTLVIGMIQWMALGLFFKAASWSIAFVFLAKGESKLFFTNESISNIYLLLMAVIGYKYFGITGLGFSFFVSWIVYLIQVYLIAKLKYQFVFTVEFYKIFIPQLILGILCFLSTKYLPHPWAYVSGIPLICLSFWFSIRELDKKLDLRSIWRKFIK